MKEINLKNRLQKFRTNANLTQEALAKLVGTTRQTIISIEKNQYSPSVKLALVLALALNTTVENIFYFE